MACNRRPVRIRYSPQKAVHLARASRHNMSGRRPVLPINRYGILHKKRLKAAFLVITMYVTYILYSKTIDQYYIGQTQNIEERLLQHNSLRSKSTKKAQDWVLVYKEIFNSRSEAMNRETEIKSKKSRKYIEKLISSIG